MVLLPTGLYVPPRIRISMSFLHTFVPIIHACTSLAFQLIFSTKVFFILKAKLDNYLVISQNIIIVCIILHHHQHDATLLKVNVTSIAHHSIQTLIPLLTLHAVTENAIIATKGLRLAPICNCICLVYKKYRNPFVKGRQGLIYSNRTFTKFARP